MRPESGSLTVELVVTAPVVALFALLGLALGRYELAREQMIDAARAGAQAASVSENAGDAVAAATSAATPVMAEHADACPSPAIATDTGAFRAGGSVRVTISCRVPVSDLGIPGLPGAMFVDVTETAPIDTYRVVQ
jgi:Flp pilus assembly protein TadG